MSGDLVQDVLLHTIREKEIKVHRGDYHVATIHREENVESKERVSEIVKGLIDSGEQIVFPLHPRTLKKIREFGLEEKIRKSGRIKLCTPLGYIDFVKLLAGASKVITDSGGVRREGYILRKPAIIAINLVWFREILNCGWKIVVGPDSWKLARAIRDFEPNGEHPNIFGNGAAHKIIADTLVQRFS